MGNTKFRLSDMIPNSWFYKLKEMGGRAGGIGAGNGADTGKRMKKAKKAYYYQQQQQHYASPSPSPPRTPLQKQTQNQQPVTPNRASYYISRRMELEANKPVVAMDTHVTFWEPPRKSKRKPRRRQLKPDGSSPRLSNSSQCGCRVRRKPAESGYETWSSTDWSQPCCTCRVTTSPTDIIIDVTAAAKKLPPIVTKPQSPETKPGEKQQSPAGDKKSPPKELHRLKTRIKSPRVLTKKTKHRKSTARRKECGRTLDGFAVVKSSSDPHRDFRESMVEMIVENNIRKSKDLEELLACYLSLNSAEYHSVIVKVFEQIWFDLN